jgi:hypothetical protein
MNQDVEVDRFERRMVSEASSFEELYAACSLEICGKGRQGAVLVKCESDDAVPIVRTTTEYKNPAQKFGSIHNNLVVAIQKSFGMDLKFNNALMEVYDDAYCKMGFHSDQSLDLEDDSFICLFSVYENPSNGGLRSLKIENKASKECGEIILEHGSAVLFSTKTNHSHVHKIVLARGAKNNRWLGITFRCSKTFVRFENEVPYFRGKQLSLASEQEKKRFFHLKANENDTDGKFLNQEIDFTISRSDLMKPI